jgi:hypothetical protein
VIATETAFVVWDNDCYVDGEDDGGGTVKTTGRW